MNRVGLVAVSVVAVSLSCRPYYNAGLLPRTGPVIAWTLLRTIAHDESSFTQGLVYADGYLYESAGGAGESRLLKVDARTGRTLALRSWPKTIAGTIRIPFAEGLALDGETLVQLSWKNERALTWSRATLRRGHDLEYDGDGWGLCFDGDGFWRSDGGSTLRRHARGTFTEERERRLTVTARGVEVQALNELECVGEHVLANVWHTPYVVIIRARDGVVVAALDFTRLVAEVAASGRESVLNGLAWDPSRRELYVTGKRWSKTYVVQPARLP